MITATERLILENQMLILHGLRALLWKATGCDGCANEVQSATEQTQDFLNSEAAEGQRARSAT